MGSGRFSGYRDRGWRVTREAVKGSGSGVMRRFNCGARKTGRPHSTSRLAPALPGADAPGAKPERLGL